MANQKGALNRGATKSLLSNAGGFMGRMGTWIKKRTMLMDTSDWVSFVLWIGTLALMFEFIGIAATSKTNAQIYANGVAAAGGVFAIMLFAAILTTVILRFMQKRREGGAR